MGQEKHVCAMRKIARAQKFDSATCGRLIWSGQLSISVRPDQSISKPPKLVNSQSAIA